MKQLRQVKLYRIDMPEASVLVKHLEQIPHREIAKSEYRNRGFVAPIRGQEKLVETFEGGYVFAVRHDEKIIPASVVSTEVQKQVEIEALNIGRNLTKKERQAIREDVIQTLCLTALVRSVVVTCFYRPDDKLLIINTTANGLANFTTGLLVNAMGAVRATTIYVDGAKGGLTTRLRNYLHDDLDTAFGKFSPTGYCQLKLPEGKSVTVRMDDVREASDGLVEGIKAGGEVIELGLSADEGLSFRLRSDFSIKGIEFSDDIEDDSEDHVAFYKNEAAIRTAQIAGVSAQLCELLGYKEPTDDLV